MKSPGLHQFVANELDELAPALAWSRLAGYWAFRVINEAARYKEYLESPDAEVDTMFLRDNADINLLYGFELEESKGQKFTRFANFYEFCYAQAFRTSINPPWDQPQSFTEIVEYRRHHLQNIRDREVDCDSFLKENEYFDMLVDASTQFERRQAKKREDETQGALDFALSEMAGRMSITSSQATQAGNIARNTLQELTVDPKDMDEVMGLEKQHEFLGDVDRDLIDEDRRFYGHGLREQYRRSAGILRAIYAYNPEIRSTLFLTVETLTRLMKVELTPITIADDWT